MRKVWKKTLTVFLLAAFCLTLLPPPVFAAKAELTPIEKITVAEKIVYGAEQEGSLVERTAKMEKEIFGAPGKDALMAKVDRIYLYVRENSPSSPSLVFKMNALEWSLTQSVVRGAVKNRLESLERTVSGQAGAGPIDPRVSHLMAITFSNSKLQTTPVTLPKDSLIKIRIVKPLDSRVNKAGDPLDFEVAEDVYLNSMLVIAKGAAGYGKVLKSEPPQNFGRDAKLEVNFESVEALDMTPAPTTLGEKAKKETDSLARAAGASIAGMILLGPFGAVGAAFIHGKNVTIPAGTVLYIQTLSDIELVGMTAK